jgi:hypothetical protein
VLYPQVEPQQWAETYAIDATPVTCENCNSTIEFKIPFAFQNFRGLLTDHKSCGDQFQQSIFVSKCKHERQGVKDFISESFFSSGAL